MEESLPIHDISEPCQIWTGIWMSLGRGVQLLARTSFGRSNRWSAVEFLYLPPLKISARSDRPIFGNLPISALLFGSIFCAKTNPTWVHLSSWTGYRTTFLEEYLCRVLCFVPEHIPLKSFEHDLQHHAGVKPVRQYCSTAADLR